MTRKEEDATTFQKKPNNRRRGCFDPARGIGARVPLDRLTLEQRLNHGLSMMALRDDGVYGDD